LLLSQTKFFNLLVRLLQVIIDDHFIVNTLRLRIFHLNLCLIQPLLNLSLLVRSPTPQPPLQLLKARRHDEQIAGLEVGLVHLLDALHLDVEHAHLAHLLDLLDRGKRRAVQVRPEPRVLDEPALLPQRLERLPRHVVVVLAVLFARPRRPRRVRHRERERARVVREQSLQDCGFARP